MKSRPKMWFAVPLGLGALTVVLAAPLQAAAQQFVYTANFGDGTISAFSVNRANGKLTEVPGSPFGAGVGPAPITHSPDGRFLYVVLTEQPLDRPCDDNPAELLSYSVEPHTGALTLLDDVALSDFCSTDVITNPSGKFVCVASIHFDPDKFGEINGFEVSSGHLTALPGSPFASPILVSPGHYNGPNLDPAGMRLNTRFFGKGRLRAYGRRSYRCVCLTLSLNIKEADV